MDIILSNLKKLQLGCLMRSLKKENGEPENIAVGQVSKELRFLQRQSEYIAEIERILRELRLTIKIIQKILRGTLNEETGSSKHDLIIYFQGIFLSLVHQAKDRMLQLVHLMTETAIPKKPTIENDITIASLLKNKADSINKIGIRDAIEEWGQENQNRKIAGALRKRSQYHHRISGLRDNNDYLN